MLDATRSHPQSLPEDPDELRSFTALLLAEVKSQAVLIEKLRHQLAGHRAHRFGTSSESIEQLQLALEMSEIAIAGLTAKLCLPDEDAKDKPKRKPIPDHIPRMEVELTTGVDDCAECGGTLRRLGEDVTEELEYVPGRFIVNRIVRPRMVCSDCECFTQVALPSRPIERGRPGLGLLAHVLVNKYADHLPLYRQSRIFEREGIDLDRSTLADWVGKSTALLEPLADAIGRHVLAGQAIFADDTPVRMLAPGTGETTTARLWAYGRDERPWNGCASPASWYRFSPDRKGQNPMSHLANYKGWMHADGYAGFEYLYRSGDIREVACMAHIRRKFVDVHKAQGSAIAEGAIARIAQLYAIEKQARGSPPDIRVTVRQNHAKSIFNELEIWLHAQLPNISGKSPLAAAIRYGLTRMARLRPYLDHGILELDNNTAERAMRSVAIGRKNYLFVGSPAGGKAAAIAYTLIETAKLNGVDPQAWLADILARIPDYKITQIDDLLPWNWNEPNHHPMEDAA
jgi:transposase